MWKLVFLVVWLAHATSQGTGESMLKPELEAELDKITEDYLSSLSLAHSRTPTRSKRDLDSSYKSLITDDKGVYRLQTVTPVSHLCSPAVFSQFLDVGSDTYAVCASEQTSYDVAEVKLGLYKNREFYPITSWYVSSPTGMAAFHYNGYIYVLIADNSREGVALSKYNIASQKVEVDHHDVSTKFTTSTIQIWKMKKDGTFHMAIGNSPEYKDLENFVTEIEIYKWKETYFDRYDILHAFDVKDIEPFHIHGTAYLAIANFRKGKRNYGVDSEIFKYDLDKKRWISHQKIRTYGATDWEFFVLGSGLTSEFFLAVANKETHKGYKGSDSTVVVYKFVKDQFVPFQCLPTRNANSIASWSTEKGFLLAVSGYEAVNLYQYDGWNFIYSNIQYTQGTMSNGVNHMTFHDVYGNEGKILVLSVSNPLHPREKSVYEIGFYHENYLQSWNAKSTEWCLNTMTKIESVNTESVIGLLDDVIFVDQPAPIVINGSLIFESGFETNRLKTPMLKEIITEEVYDGSMIHTLQLLHQKLQEMSAKLAEFDEVLSKSLRISGDQIVSGHLEFQDVSFDCQGKSCNFESLNTKILNGEEIGDWANNLVFLDRDQVIKGPIFAEKIHAHDLIVRGMIDGINTQNLVTKSGNHIITAPKTFEALVTAKDLHVNGYVDGVKISPQDVLLTTGYQEVTGDLTFDDIVVSWMDVNGLINGINLTSFYEDVVLSDQPATITGQKVFENVIAEDLVMIPGSTINGIDVVDLWKNALWLEGQQEVTAHLNFDSVSILKNLNAFNGINDIQIPGLRVVDINSPANVTAHHAFEQSTRVNELIVLESLNGLGTYLYPGKLPQLDILMKTADHPQVVTGAKTFQTIHLDADSIVTGTVDGVDLSIFKEMALHRNPVMNPNRTWIFKNLEIKGSLNANKISGHDLASLYEKSLKLTDEHIPAITFKETVYIDELVSRNINGIDIENDFVLSNKDQDITGKKTFENINLQENSIVVGLVNNINLSFLNETILFIGNQVINSKVFKRDVKFNKLTVTGSINGVKVSDLATITGDNTLHSEELRGVSFVNITANNLDVTGTVNGIDVQDMLDDTMTYDGSQTVTGKKTIKGSIRVHKGNFLSVDNINGVNINDLWEDSVLTDVPQNIYGVKTFENSVAFNNLIFKSTIDGISEANMMNWMLKDEPQTVEANVVFWDTTTVGNLNVMGKINGLNITELDESIVKINEPNIIEGHITFENLQVLGNITLSGKIQGVDLSEEAVLKSGDKVVTGMKTFTNDLVVNGDAFVGGTVDGIKVEDLCRDTLLLGEEQTITQLTIKGDVIMSGGGKVNGKLAGIDLNDLRDMALPGESQFDYEGVKTFQDLEIEGDVTLEGLFGGVNITLLDQTYMSLTRNQNITAQMTFEDVDFKGTLKATDFSTQNKRINDLDLSNINGRILMNVKDQNITVEHHFDEVVFEDIFVLGKVNGLDVPNGLMRKNQSNFIQSPKLFEKPVTITGDLVMINGMINNVDVSHWFKKAVMKDGGKYVIDGIKTFETLDINDARIHGKLDGLEISDKKLLMNYGNQVITGQKTIIGEVEVRGSVTLKGDINGIKLENLSENTLRHDRSSLVTGSKYFTKLLSIQNLTAPSIAGVNIEELEKKVNRHIDWGNLPYKLNEINTVMGQMEDSLNKQAIVFQYYELFQSFTIPTAYRWHYTSGNDCGELLLLVDYSNAKQCSVISLYNYDPIQKDFQPLRSKEIFTSRVTSVKTMYVWNTTYLFVANQYPEPDCASSASNMGLWNTTGNIYTWVKNGFEIFQQIETFPLDDMVVFFDGNMCCVVFISLNNPEVYCSKGEAHKFVHYGTIKAKGAKKASILNTNGKIYLAVVIENSNPIRTYTEEKPIEIYIWDPATFKFGKPIVPLMSTYAQSVQLMSYNKDLLSTVFLAISEGQIPRIQNEPRILIYKLEDSSKQFQKFQEIKDYGDLEWILLETGELILFALDSFSGKVKLYQHKGASGFVLIDTVKSIPSSGSVSLHPFIRHEDPDDSINHYLALAGPQTLIAQPSQGGDYAKILKSKMKGRRSNLL